VRRYRCWDFRAKNPVNTSERRSGISAIASRKAAWEICAKYGKFMLNSILVTDLLTP